MNNFVLRKDLPGVKHIVVVASGKGGVGKSTVASNLAITLAKKGYKTALLDADIYGPSIPKIFGIENEKLEFSKRGDEDVMLPIERYGVKINSIGLIVSPEESIIWRGPLAANVLGQLFNNTDWGEIDYMVVDFPPGTGDIQLSAMQQFNISAAIVVTTPQIISVNDARKGADMFSAQKMNVPLLGVIENMSWFTPKEHPEEKYYIFGSGGGNTLAKEFNTLLLAQIPLIKEIGISSEEGQNLMEMNNSEINTIFDHLVQELESQLIEDEYTTKSKNFKIAVPTVDGKVDEHFGHCDHYTIFEINAQKEIIHQEELPSGQGCGCKSNIVSILHDMGVKVMLAGNMGEGAKNVLEASQISVIRGCSGDVNQLVSNYLRGKITDSGVGCSAHGHDCGHHHEC